MCIYIVYKPVGITNSTLLNVGVAFPIESKSGVTISINQETFISGHFFIESDTEFFCTEYEYLIRKVKELKNNKKSWTTVGIGHSDDGRTLQCQIGEGITVTGMMTVIKDKGLQKRGGGHG